MIRRILVIEDEPAIRRGVADALRASGYEPVEAADGAAGLDAGLTGRLDLVLLDLVLPRRDGMAVLAELHRARPALPVIVLTARGAESDRVAGLRAGADDYVVKPFSARGLLARVEAVLRRTPARPQDVQRARIGRAVIDLGRREVCCVARPESSKGVAVGTRREESTTPFADSGRATRRSELSESEAAILGYLLACRDRAVTREELLARLWGIGDGVETRTIDMHVTRLRQKLRDAAGRDADDAIVTVRGRGYMAGEALSVER